MIIIFDIFQIELLENEKRQLAKEMDNLQKYIKDLEEDNSSEEEVDVYIFLKYIKIYIFIILQVGQLRRENGILLEAKSKLTETIGVALKKVKINNDDNN